MGYFRKNRLIEDIDFTEILKKEDGEFPGVN